jgi:hemerythrin-like metal-binding protein
MEWTQELALGDERIDSTHREFVALVDAVGKAPDAAMLGAIDALIAHTEAHFGQEKGWMAATAFPSTHCHLDEHAGVLGAIQEVRGYVSEGKFHVGQVLARELDTWFKQHAATMDSMLAQWLRQCKFDTTQELATQSEPGVTTA